MASARILVVDDEPNARGALRTILTEEGYGVSEAGDGVEALSVLRNAGADLVLADVRMPRMDGLTLLREARESGIDAAFVVMTAFGSIEMAVEAMRAGAENFLVKPLDERAVLVVIEKALEKRRLAQEAANLRVRVRERVRFDNIVGDSPVCCAVRWIAASISGESFGISPCPSSWRGCGCASQGRSPRRRAGP